MCTGVDDRMSNDMGLNTNLVQQDWEDIFDTITDIITIHDRDYNIIWANKAAKKMFRLPSLEGKNLKCFKHYHGADNPPDECPSCNCLKTGTPLVVEFFEPHLNKFLEVRAMPRLKDKEITGLIHIVRDITERKRVEGAFIQSRENLIEQSRKIKESNTALKVLLGRIENDKKVLEDKMLMNIKLLIEPYVEKLKHGSDGDVNLEYINILESNLNNIASSFSLKMSSQYFGLTPKEIQIANLIKEGKQSKDIAEILHSSFETINCHRQNIRKKLGISNSKVNLRSFLLSLS
jgi:PAS domain S-box-containing protein